MTMMLDIPGYTIDEVLSEGVKNIVYRGHSESGDPVIIKTPVKDNPEPRQIARFQRAFDLGVSIDSETVVPRHIDLLRYQSSVALITADFDGVPLSTVIPESGFSLGHLIRISLALAKTLSRLHASGLLHKDIKPDNILINMETYAVRFIDLGLATSLSREACATKASNTIEGTFQYTAPEQCGRIDSPVDERSDLYSLGVTLFHLATGELPFNQGNPAELAHAHVALLCPRVSELRKDLPVIFSDMLARLLEKNIEDRYASAAGLAHDLQHCFSSLEKTGNIRRFGIARHDISPVFRISNKLYGRQTQCEKLDEVFEEGCKGKRALIRVSGLSGVGKTRFVNHMQSPILSRGARFCSGKFDQFHPDRPYLGVISAFRGLLRSLLAEPESTLMRYREKLQEAVGIQGRLLTDSLPELLLIIGSQPAVDDLVPLDAARRFNGLVARFLQVFATAQSPLVLFIDDLQWADPASIKLLEAIATLPGLDYLVLILGDRSNEPGSAHPARLALDALHQSARSHALIALGPLEKSDTKALVADTLHVSETEVDSLSNYIHRFAGGNVFFVREFLMALRERAFFHFDEIKRKWAWDIEDLSHHTLPDQVADLLTHRISGMPESCLDLLDTASCIGGEFDLKTIASVHEISQSDAAMKLAPAVKNSLVFPLDTNHTIYESLAPWGNHDYEDIGEARYRFQHDQVRLRVHDHLDDGERKKRHLHIGRLLVTTLSKDELSIRAVEVFDHLIHGLDRVTDPSERLSFAELGLKAGKSAQGALAFKTANTLLKSAEAFLSEDAWSQNYPLALGINLALAECAFALEHSESFESRIALILDQVKTPNDATSAYGLLIRVRNTQTRYVEAVDIAVKVAASLGVHLPRKPKLPHVLYDAARTLWVQGRQNPLVYENHPELDDPEIEAAISLLTQSLNAVYFAEPNLLPLIATTCTRLSIKHGMSPSSPYGLATWAVVLSGALGMIDKGYQFGKLALRLAQRYGGPEEARTRFVVDCFVKHWKEPLIDTAMLLHKDWEFNRDAGDEESAVYCAGALICVHLFSGVSIDADLRYEGIVDYIVDCNKPHVKDSFLAWSQLHAVLRAEELPADLRGQWFNLAEKLPEFERTNNGVQICHSLCASGILDHLAGRFDRAEERFSKAMKLEEFILSTSIVPGLAFFRALNAYHLLAEKPSNRRLLRMAKRQTRRLRKWAKFAPFNLAHRVSLLVAEEQLLQGRSADAVMSLHKAIDQAASTAAVFYQALAERRLSECLAMQKYTTQAKAAKERARISFTTWGSKALANRMDFRMGTAVNRAINHANDAITTEADGLDLQSLLEAVRTISSEMNPEILLERLMGTVMQHAGADRGILILKDTDDQALVELVLQANGQNQGPGIPLSAFKEISRPVVDLALRTRETVVINDAQTNDIVLHHPYTSESYVRSIQASCIVLQNRVIGLIYLENHLANAAFTAERVEITEALGAQAGIALENARLYQRTQEALKMQTALSAANRRFVPHEFLSGLGCSSIVDVGLNLASEQNMSILFVDLRSFTGISKTLGPTRTIKMINRYLSYVQPGIVAYNGFVGLYYGDGILALFPGGASDAIQGAIAMCRGLETYNAEREDFPALRFGIGIHSGPVTMGTMGDPDHFQCAVLGDSVNLASRIEALTKYYLATLLVSGATYRQLDISGQLACRYLGRVQVPGHSEVIDLYECLGAYAVRKRKILIAGRDVFNKAIEVSIEGDWAKAITLFDECICFCPDDQVSRKYKERCLARVQDQLKWDGIERVEKSY